MAMDQGKIPSEIKALLTGEEQSKAQQNSTKLAKAGKTEAHSNNPCEYHACDNKIESESVFIQECHGGRQKHKSVFSYTNDQL